MSTRQTNAIRIEGDVPSEVARLRQQLNLLICGSAQLVNLLMRHDLIDRYRLMVHPVVVGEGKPLFDAGDNLKGLRLAGQQATSAGVMVLDYEPASEG